MVFCSISPLIILYDSVRGKKRNFASIDVQKKIRRGSALRLPWATARDRPYHET